MNYANIAAAVDFYGSLGYSYFEDVPWYVDWPAYNATRPPNAIDMRIGIPSGTIGNLVASGEQSFIQMMIDGQPLKRAICVTPCFRWESKTDGLHRRNFIKAELINGHDVDESHLILMLHEACNFFEKFVSVRVVKTTIGYDIVEKHSRIELGSYGMRSMEFEGQELQWIYGTGCAEPRLSTAIKWKERHTSDLLCGRIR